MQHSTRCSHTHITIHQRGLRAWCGLPVCHQASPSKVRCTPPRGGGRSAAEVVEWAQQQFQQQVSRPDSNIQLAKVCMLLALEEEAAAQLDTTQAPNSDRTSATASTWSLSRLDALAAEVVDLLTADSSAGQLQQGMRCEQHPATSPETVEQPHQHQQQQQQQQQNQQRVQPGVSATAAAFAAVRQQAQLFPMAVLNAVNAVLFQRHGYTACNRFGASVDSQLSSVLEYGPGSVAALTILYLEVCSRVGLACGFKVVEDGRYCLVWPTHQQQQQQQQQQQATQQDMAQQQPLAQEQDEPRFTPQQQEQEQKQLLLPTLLSVGGEACVVDVYGEGALLPVSEATELFGLSPQELLAGSSRRELLAALLQELQAAHWCAAVGCSPTPALMTPLTAGTAVRHAVVQLHGAGIERAAAAAAKRVVLLGQQDSRAQLELALLCYFSGRYEDALLELGCYLEQVKADAQQKQQDTHQHVQQAVGMQQQAGPAGATSTSGSSSSTGNAGDSSTTATSGGSGGGGSSGSSAASNRVTELHAAIQSMLIGGALVPDAPPSSTALTAAEAALASADEEEAGSKVQRQEQQELADIVLLFHKLQLELMMAGASSGGRS